MEQFLIDQYYLKICNQVATRGTCPRKKVGAITVLNDKILGTGFNGSPRGTEHCEIVGCKIVNDHCIRSVHAEVNAILFSGQGLQNATLYCNLEPCLNCLKFAINVGIKRVIYSEEYSFDLFKYDLIQQSEIIFGQVRNE